MLGLFEERGVKVEGLAEELLGIISGMRERLRTEKNYKLSDVIREELSKVGVILEDKAEGTSWKIERR